MAVFLFVSNFLLLFFSLFLEEGSHKTGSQLLTQAGPELFTEYRLASSSYSFFLSLLKTGTRGMCTVLNFLFFISN